MFVFCKKNVGELSLLCFLSTSSNLNAVIYSKVCETVIMLTSPVGQYRKEKNFQNICEKNSIKISLCARLVKFLMLKFPLRFQGTAQGIMNKYQDLIIYL